MSSCLVRAATSQDAEFAVDVLRDSITKLCALAHQDDAGTLERWLANKTVEQFERWLSSPEMFLIVAEVESKLCGVGSMRMTGDITLCYVKPGWQGSGIGSALLAALEGKARALGLSQCRLSSSANARSFYERHGYASAGAPVPSYGVLVAYPYEKYLR